VDEQMISLCANALSAKDKVRRKVSSNTIFFMFKPPFLMMFIVSFLSVNLEGSSFDESQ
jgi:hypothetical protein